jgi:hypothetical protein
MIIKININMATAPSLSIKICVQKNYFNKNLNDLMTIANNKKKEDLVLYCRSSMSKDKYEKHIKSYEEIPYDTSNTKIIYIPVAEGHNDNESECFKLLRENHPYFGEDYLNNGIYKYKNDDHSLSNAWPI